MGMPFSFSIDSDLLVLKRSASDGWEYFVPAGQKFSASHGLLGSVIREGDTVGLRIHSSGRQEWFVDNSQHNGYQTIWSRKIKKKDPAFVKIMTSAVNSSGSNIDRLVYLGATNNLAKIRHEQIRPNGSTTRDEFTFPLNQAGEGAGAVRGAEFVMKVGPLRAVITVKTEMTSGIGEPMLTSIN